MRRAAYLLLLVSIVGGSLGARWFNGVEVPEQTRESKFSSFVCLSDIGEGACELGNSVARFQNGSTRSTVTLEQISPFFVDALIASEDANFFTHSGVDPIGIARALYRDIRGSASRQGGSTITQQYVKNVFLTSERTLDRKLNEAAIAIKLEREWSKEQILERYVNEVYFGRSAVGVEAAAQAYFGKPALTLNLPESAFLASIIRSPNSYDPAERPTEAAAQRRKALVRMRDTNKINQQQFEEADAYPWQNNVLPKPKTSNGIDVSNDFREVGGRHIANMALSELRSAGFKDSAIFTKGLKVYLTIDRAMQDKAVAAIRSTLTQPAEDPLAAVATLSPKGEVLAMVGGLDDESEVNLATGMAGGGQGRAVASTMKPLMLAVAIEQGYSIKSELPGPAEIVIPDADNGADWSVSNFNNHDWGKLSIEQATWNSVNTVYAQLVDKLGAKSLVEMAERLGMRDSDKQVIKRNDSLVLGAVDGSPLGMARVYNTLGHHGVFAPSHIVARVEDAEGNVLYTPGDNPKLAAKEAISSESADAVAGVLAGVMKNGSGTNAYFGRPAGGKTGTDSDSNNAWFVGFTCNVTTAVWMGYDPQRPMVNLHGFKEVNGGSLPALIWNRYMKDITGPEEGCSFKVTDPGTKQFPVNPELQTGPTGASGATGSTGASGSTGAVASTSTSTSTPTTSTTPTSSTKPTSTTTTTTTTNSKS